MLLQIFKISLLSWFIYRIYLECFTVDGAVGSMSTNNNVFLPANGLTCYDDGHYYYYEASYPYHSSLHVAKPKPVMLQHSTCH